MPDPAPGAAGSARLPLIDLARAFALLHMVLFHLGRDLDTVAPGLAGAYGFSFAPAWQGWAVSIAGSFVFLAGASLQLAHGRGLRTRAFLRRLALLVAAAAAVSLATYVTFPGQWVRFGILHSIAASSVVGLAFLRLPPWVTAGAGAGAVALGLAVGGPEQPFAPFDGPLWLWTGLGQPGVWMMDYEPLLPWTGPFLLGMAAARGDEARGWLAALRGRPRGRLWDRLAWPGRHSLWIYLAHQPILVGAILLWIRLTG